MSTFFIADTHFGEENIMRYENRPFKNMQEMNDTMIANWNHAVKEDDCVYVLGDFGADKQEKDILHQLNGCKYLVKGNHDIYSNDYYRNAGFKEVYDYPIVLNDFWMLSHEPMYINENMPYANLFGHVHASPIFNTYSKQHYCVSVERLNYTPISFEKIIAKVKNGESDTI